MVARGTLKGDDFRIIFTSPIFPTSSFAYAHDLKPELVRKIRACFFAFHFPPSMQKEFNGDDRFYPDHLQGDLEGGARHRRGVRNALQQGGLRRGIQARGGGAGEEAQQQPAPKQ